MTLELIKQGHASDRKRITDLLCAVIAVLRTPHGQHVLRHEDLRSQNSQAGATRTQGNDRTGLNQLSG